MRPRKSKNRDLAPVPNLYGDAKRTAAGIKVYWKYVRPTDKKVVYWGALSKAKAVRLANMVNQQLLPEADLIAKTLGSGVEKIVWGEVLNAFSAEYPSWQTWAKRTADEHRSRIRRLRRLFGDRDFQTYTLADLNAHLGEFQGDGRKQARNLLIHIYAFAISKGWKPDMLNLAKATLKSPAAKRKRPRLTIEEFKKCRETAPEWLKCAMDLSLKTLQGRAEICNMLLSDADLDSGRLKVIRGKTKDKTERAYISIRIDDELRDIISRCQRLPVAGPWMVRRKAKTRNGTNTRGKVTLKKLTTEFGKYWGKGDTSKTAFHEIRSLGARLLEQQLIDAGRSRDQAKEVVNYLLCHTSMKTTELYLQDDQPKFIEVDAPLRLSGL